MFYSVDKKQNPWDWNPGEGVEEVMFQSPPQLEKVQVSRRWVCLLR